MVRNLDRLILHLGWSTFESIADEQRFALANRAARLQEAQPK